MKTPVSVTDDHVTKETLSPERIEELQRCLEKMEAVVDLFYRQAVGIQNHPFIEFAGLMYEYIKVCRTTLGEGIDFTQCSGHGNIALVFRGYNRDYLLEKLNCIYGPSLRALIEVDPV